MYTSHTPFLEPKGPGGVVRAFSLVYSGSSVGGSERAGSTAHVSQMGRKEGGRRKEEGEGGGGGGKVMVYDEYGEAVVLEKPNSGYSLSRVATTFNTP